MEKLYYDFHIHSCLSPCGDNESTPSSIVGMAVVKELDAVALTDHNSTFNCKAFLKAAEALGIVGIPGAEVCTEEEIHCVCLFESLDGAEQFGNYIYDKTPDIKNDIEVYGHQYIMDEDDNILGEADKILVNACSVSVTELPHIVRSYGGVCFPAHIDKSSYSILAMLGMIPPECEFTAAEISKPTLIDKLVSEHKILENMNILTSSDAHYLWDISEKYYFLSQVENNTKAIIEKLKNYK